MFVQRKMWMSFGFDPQKPSTALESIHASWISNDIDPATKIERIVPISLPYIRANHLMMLVTDLGFIDLFDYVPDQSKGDPTSCFAESIESQEGIRYVSLEWLRRMKRASGRSKDKDDLAALGES
jgi:hypothetical protein